MKMGNNKSALFDIDGRWFIHRQKQMTKCCKARLSVISL